MGKHKRLGAIVVVSGVLIAVFVAFFFVFLPYIIKPTVSLSLGTGVFSSTVATTEADRTKGLSEVPELSAGKAFIMVFPTESRWKIWMNGVKIPVDIVWLDKDKTVVYIVKNASPGGLGNKSFEPKKMAKYVIEFPTGTVDDMNIKIDQSAKFDFSEENVQ